GGDLRHASIVGNRGTQSGGAVVVDATEANRAHIFNSLIRDNWSGGGGFNDFPGYGEPMDEQRQILRETWRDEARFPDVRGSCVEGLSGEAALAGGNLDGCEPGLRRRDWRVEFHEPGSDALAPGLGSALIDAGLVEGIGPDTADLDADGDTG